MDYYGDHAVGCRCGYIRNGRHDGAGSIWCNILKEAGYETNKEVLVPEWWEKCTEKEMAKKRKAGENLDKKHTKRDIVATPQSGGCELYVDITYRHALRKRW